MPRIFALREVGLKHTPNTIENEFNENLEYAYSIQFRSLSLSNRSCQLSQKRQGQFFSAGVKILVFKIPSSEKYFVTDLMLLNNISYLASEYFGSLYKIKILLTVQLLLAFIVFDKTPEVSKW